MPVYMYICVCGRDGGGDLPNLIKPPNIWAKTSKAVSGKGLAIQQGEFRTSDLYGIVKETTYQTF